MGLTGDGSSLWFDKCLTIAMFQHTTMSLANMEHSGTDATVSFRAAASLCGAGSLFLSAELRGNCSRGISAGIPREQFPGNILETSSRGCR